MIDVRKIKLPVIKEGYEFWLAKSAGGRLPSRADISPRELSPLLPFLFLVDVGRDPLHFRFRLVGSSITQWARKEYTGFVMRDQELGEGWQRAFDDFKSVVETGKPRLDEPSAAWVGRGIFRFERVLAPLSDDGANVTMLLGFLQVLAPDPDAHSHL